MAFGGEATLGVLVMSEALEEGFRLTERAITIFIKEKEMPHFASGPDLVFAVQVEADLGMSQEAIPWRRPVPPQISKEIHHHDGAKERRVPQGQPANGAEMLLELRGRAGTQCEVPTVMRPRRHLIDQKSFVLKKKEFRGHDPTRVKGLCE